MIEHFSYYDEENEKGVYNLSFKDYLTYIMQKDIDKKERRIGWIIYKEGRNNRDLDMTPDLLLYCFYDVVAIYYINECSSF